MEKDQVFDVLKRDHLGNLSPRDFLEKVFFQQLVTTYHKLRIELRKSMYTDWTQELVGYAVSLGKDWKFRALREKAKWDARYSIHVDNRDVPVLRFEHENSTGIDKIYKTLEEKLVNTAEQIPSVVMLVGIIYPENQRASDDWIMSCARMCLKSLPNDCTLLLILDSSCYKRWPGIEVRPGADYVASLNGHIFTKKGRIRIIRAVKGVNLEGFFYAYLERCEDFRVTGKIRYRKSIS